MKKMISWGVGAPAAVLAAWVDTSLGFIPLIAATILTLILIWNGR